MTGRSRDDEVELSDRAREPAGYAELLEQLKARVRASRVRAARTANSELLKLYWSVGRDILDRQEHAGWGSRVIDRLAADLREEFPDQRGWSRRNLHYMRALAEAWPEQDFVQQAAAQLPWGHLMVLLDKLSTRQERDWYAVAATEHGWSRDVLVHQVASRLAERIGSAPSNFAAALPAPDSELAQQLVRDPYVFDHLALSDAMWIGVAQAMALVPGVSRSGATICAALVLGLRRSDAARFSFLLGIPAIAGAGLLELPDAVGALGDDALAPLLIGTLTSAVVGYLSIAWLLRYLGRRPLTGFASYRIVLGVIVIGLLVAGVIEPFAGT